MKQIACLFFHLDDCVDEGAIIRYLFSIGEVALVYESYEKIFYCFIQTSSIFFITITKTQTFYMFFFTVVPS